MTSPLNFTREQIEQTIKRMTDYQWFEKGNSAIFENKP